jgi:hypothetical protein
MTLSLVRPCETDREAEIGRDAAAKQARGLPNIRAAAPCAASHSKDDVEHLPPGTEHPAGEDRHKAR